MSDPVFTSFEQGERTALLRVRSFLLSQGFKSSPAINEIDAYCAQRLHDIREDAKDRDDARREADRATRQKREAATRTPL